MDFATPVVLMLLAAVLTALGHSPLGVPLLKHVWVCEY